MIPEPPSPSQRGMITKTIDIDTLGFPNDYCMPSRSTGELRIPKANYGPLALLELIERHTGATA